jgi:integration host factor subunit alpha
MNMTNKTLTRADLSAAVYREIGLSLSESTVLVDAVIDELSGSLAQGDSVKLSSFGTFNLRRKKQRIGRNPKTGVEVPITPRTVLSFNASNILKSEVNTSLINNPEAAAGIESHSGSDDDGDDSN